MPSHPVVGDLDLAFEAMDLTSDTGLQLLANWAETVHIDSTRNNAPITTDNADTAD